MLDRVKKTALRQVMDSPGWDILKEVLALHISGLNDTEVTGNDAFQALRSLHRKEGGVEELKKFFEKVENLNFEE